MRPGVLRPPRAAGAAAFVAGGLMSLPFEAAIPAPPPAVLEYRHHMFDPPIMTLANRSNRRPKANHNIVILPFKKQSPMR